MYVYVYPRDQIAVSIGWRLHKIMVELNGVDVFILKTMVDSGLYVTKKNSSSGLVYPKSNNLVWKSGHALKYVPVDWWCRMHCQCHLTSETRDN